MLKINRLILDGANVEVREIFKGVYKIDGKLATRNLAKGNRVYNEELISHNGVEYRMWNPYRSKLAAAIMKGMKNMSIEEGQNVLYLGAATGTTCSHVSDIVGGGGAVYCIEISERNMRELIMVCEKRENMIPILSDARKTDSYGSEVGEADVIYQDVSARDQAGILLANSSFLRKGGYAYVAIKSQSINVSKKPSEVYAAFFKEVAQVFEIIEKVDIMPYDEKHMFAVLRKL